MTDSNLIQATYKIEDNEAILYGEDHCGVIAVALGDVAVEDGGIRVTPGTTFRLVTPATDQLPENEQGKRATARNNNVYSTTCLPFGSVSYLYECTPEGLKYIGPCGMPSPCGYPCTR